jgi:hypothetical protein
MANINELEWATPEGEIHSKAITTIGKLNVIITKLDDDSFIITSGEISHESNLVQLETMLTANIINWGVDTMSLIQQQLSNELNEQKLVNELDKFYTESIWKSIDGVGEKVLDVPHLIYPGCIMRLIKLDDDSFKTAVIGLPPNDGDEITYIEINGYIALVNYVYAMDSDIGQLMEYIQKRKDASEQTEQTDFEVIE